MRVLKVISLVVGIILVVLPVMVSFVFPFFMCSAPFLMLLGLVFLLFNGLPQRILESIYFIYLRRRKPVLAAGDEIPLPNFLTLGTILYSFFVAVGTGFAIYASIVMPVTTDGSLPDLPLPIAVMLTVGLVLGLGGQAIAFFLHFWPNARRHVKYTIFLSSYGVIKGCSVLGMTLQSLDASVEERISFVLLFLAVDMVVLLASSVGFSFWLNPYFLGREVAEEPSISMRRFFFIVRRFQVLSAFAFYFLPFLPFLPYLHLRYYLVERFRRHPILYFRSFGLESTPAFFSRIILREASRFGVVVCLAHESQRPYQIQGEVHPLAYGKMVILKDEVWQAWVERELRRAAAVIIDITKPTDGLDWEVERTRVLVAEHRILVLRQEGFSNSGSEKEQGLQVIQYTSTETSRKALRRYVRGWLIDIMFGKATAG